MLLLYDVLYVGLCVSDSSCVQLLSEAPWVVPFSAIHVKDSTKLRAWIFTDQHLRLPDNIFFFIHSWRLHSLGIGAFQSSSKHTHKHVHTYLTAYMYFKKVYLRKFTYIKKQMHLNMYNHQTSFLNLEKDPSLSQPIPKTCWLMLIVFQDVQVPKDVPCHLPRRWITLRTTKQEGPERTKEKHDESDPGKMIPLSSWALDPSVPLPAPVALEGKSK